MRAYARQAVAEVEAAQLEAEAEDAAAAEPDGMGAGARGGCARARAHSWEARWLTVCEESVVLGRVTAAKIMWRRLRSYQREALKTTALWAADEEIDEKADWALPAGALDERDDWQVQWVRVCVEGRLAGTERTARAVEDLWFS